MKLRHALVLVVLVSACSTHKATPPAKPAQPAPLSSARAAAAPQPAPTPARTPAVSPSAPGTQPVAAPATAGGLAPAVPGDPMGVVVTTLPNGFTVMLSENHEEPRIHCLITTRAGSAKDPADATGLAHYLEHMNFKGTGRMGTLDFAKEKPHLDRITQLYDQLFVTPEAEKRAEIFKQIDAENVAANQFEAPSEIDTLYSAYGFKFANASTTDDRTSYTVDIPANRLDTWAEVEVERFSDPVYRLFTTELEAVYEEKNQSLDNKGWILNEALRLALFPHHPYGTQPTIGTVEHLKNPSLTKIYEYFHTWYVPSNMVIALAGDFRTADAIAVLEKRFGAIPAKAAPPAPNRPVQPPQGVKRVETRYEAEEQLDIAWITVPATDPEADALKLADMMLSNGRTGLIDVNINQKQLAQSATSGPDLMVEAGYEVLQGTAKDKQPLEDVEKLLLEQVELLKKGAFSEDDLKAALTDFEISQKQQLESNSARTRVMTEAFVEGKPWDWKVHELDRMRKVAKDDVVRVANKYFGGNYVVAYRRTGKPDLPKITKPGFTAVKTKADTHSQFYETMLAKEVPPIEPHFLEIGRDFVTKDLKSGQLVWAKNPANDLFQVSFVFDTGTDDDARLGIAFGLLDFGGAGDLDTVAFKRKLYSLGTTLSAGAGRQETIVSMSGLAANFEESLRLLRAHFEAPTGASQADLDRFVERIVSSHAKQKIDPRSINAALVSFAQRGPESDFLRQIKDEDLRKLKSEDLVALTRGVWGTRHRVLYAGSRAADDVAALVDLAPIGGDFASMTAPPARRSVQYVVPEKPRILYVDKNAAQMQVNVFFFDGQFDRAAIPVHRVYNEYMNGSMGGVVFQEIREFRALAYSAGTVYRDAGWKGDDNLFMGAMSIQADKTPEALEVLMRIIRDLPAAEPRMDNVKRTIDETYRSFRVPFRSIPSTVLGWWRQGFDADPRPWNWEQIRKMTLADVVAFASRWKSRPSTITIVGDVSKFDLTKLAEYGEITKVDPETLFGW